MVLSKRHTQWIFIEIISISVLQVPFRGFRGLGLAFATPQQHIHVLGGDDHARKDY